MHKRTITVGAILGVGLLGTLFAMAQESALPRPRPVMPPPAKETDAPLILPETPAASAPTLVETPAEPPMMLPDLPATPKAPTLEPKDVIQPVQHLEIKPAPKVPAPVKLDAPPDFAPLFAPPAAPVAPMPPVAPINEPLPQPLAPPVMFPVAPPVIEPTPVPVPPPVMVIPEVKEPVKAPVSASPKPWTPTDTPAQVDPKIDVRAPLLAPLDPPIQRTPSIPVNDTVPGTPRFVVAPRSTASQPAQIPPLDSAPVQPQTAPPPIVPDHGIYRFTPVRSKQVTANKVASPAPLVQESPRLKGPELAPYPPNSLLGALTPQITFEKRGPLLHKIGGPLKYQIVLKNVGAVTAQSVRVEDEIPGARLNLATPDVAQQQGDRLVWILPSLRPGEEQTIIEEVIPIRPGEVVSTTSVHVYASTSFRTRLDGDIPAPHGLSRQLDPTPGPLLNVDPTPIQRPLELLPPNTQSAVQPNVQPKTPVPPQQPEKIPMTVEVKALPTVELGKKLVFEVVIANIGTTPLTKMVLYGKIPVGFSHPEGDTIGADLPDMAPGDTKVYKMPMTAVAAGKYLVEVRVTAAPNFELVASPVITVESRGLTIQQSANPRMTLGRDNEIKIVIGNNQATPLTQVQVTDVLPEGLEFVSASDRADYSPKSRTITWMLETVPAGRSRTLSVRVQPKSNGSYPHEVVARVDELPEARSTNVLQVEGSSALQVTIQDRDDPLEQGKDTVYAVRITNTSAMAATNVHAVISLSDGLDPSGFAQAPTAYRISGRDIVFSPIPKLQPGATATIHLGARGSVAGSQNVRVQVVSDQLRAPAVREERTQVREK